jgi:hypothetical protein
MGRRFRRNKIEARCSVRVAAAQPAERHPAASPQAVAVQRFVAEFGAGRQVPAMKTDQGR